MKKLSSWFLFINTLRLIYIQQNKHNLGDLWNQPTWLSQVISLFGLHLNLNGLGNSYTIHSSKLSLVHQVEKQVIEWNKDVIYAPQFVEGYLTSGGTESNIFLMWCGREKLLQTTDQLPVVVGSDFTHYSVTKAARLLGLQYKAVGIDKKTWSMSVYEYKKTVTTLLKKGQHAILTPITIGYSSLGTSDALTDIIEVVQELQKKYPQFQPFLWIDAAMQGLAKTFLEDRFSPFSDQLIQGYVVDFHKLGQAALPAGLVLYRQSLRKYIEAPIHYLSETDATLLGSRPGFAILGVWSVIQQKRTNFQKDFQELIRLKEKVVTELRLLFGPEAVITEKNSLTFALTNVTLPDGLLKKYALKKWSLPFTTAGQKKKLLHYKFFVLQRNKHAYEEFLSDIYSWLKQ